MLLLKKEKKLPDFMVRSLPGGELIILTSLKKGKQMFWSRPI
jgi:hypothetical protein